MKTRFEVAEIDSEDLVALFGSGRLVRVSRLQLELRGGTKDDEIEAVGWVAMFMPDFILAKPGTPVVKRFH